MAIWTVAGGGTTAANGSHVETGIYGGKPAYTNGTYWLFWTDMPPGPPAGRWEIAPSLGATAYYAGENDTELPGGTWITVDGTPPAPTLTLDTSGGGDQGYGMVLEITSPLAPANITPGTLQVGFTATFTDVSAIPVPPVNLVLRLHAIAVYEDGAGDGLETYHYGVLTFVADEAVFTGVVNIPISAAHSTFALQLYGWATLTDSGGPPTVWWAADGDVETPFTISGAPPGDPPTVRITSPANGATVNATVAVAILATDTEGLATVVLAIDGVTVLTQTVAGLQASVTYQWDTTLETNADHILTATATDSDALTDTDTIVVTVSNGAPGGGTPPTCQIYYPTGGTVSGDVEVDLRALDDGTIAHAWFYIDGALVASWDPALATWQQLWTWDTLGYGNGTHTLDLTVEDNTGNVVLATRRTVTVSNTAATGGSEWWSEQFSQIPAAASPLAAQVAEQVALGRYAQRGLVTAVIEQAALPENNCGIQFAFLAGDTHTGWDDAQPLIPDTVMAFLPAWQDGWLGLKFTSLIDWQQWALAIPAVIDHQVISDTKLLFMVAGPPAVIYKWNGADNPEVWLDLTGTEWAGYTGIGFRVLGAKCYLATTSGAATPQPAILVQDLDGAGEPDATQQTYSIEFASRNPHAVTDIEVVGQYAVVGTDDAAGNGDLWQLDADEVRFLSAAVPGVRCLWADGTTLYIGGADGHVWTGGASQYTTGEAHCNAGLVVSGKHYLCTGTGGKVYRRTGTTWELLATIPTLTEPKPLGVYYGRVWFGGNGADLYALDLGSGVFQKYCVTSFSAITDLVGFAGMLVVFGTGGGNIYKSLRITSSHLTGYLVHDAPALQVLEWA